MKMASTTIVLITGANTGLGYEIVRALCQSPRPYTVLLGGRNIDKASDAARRAKLEFPTSLSAIQLVHIDIEDDISILQLFYLVSGQYGYLDVLINNAGGQFDQQFYQGKMSMRDMWNKSWNVNTTSTNVLTDTFVPLLLKSAEQRLIFIASGTSSLAENGNTALAFNKSPLEGWLKELSGVPAYRSSKTSMNMMMREWYRILKADGVKTWCVSPGFLATGLGAGSETNRKLGAIDPAIGGRFVVEVVEGKRDHDVGKVIREDDIQSW